MLYQLSYLGIFARPGCDRTRKSASYRCRFGPCPAAIARWRLIQEQRSSVVVGVGSPAVSRTLFAGCHGRSVCHVQSSAWDHERPTEPTRQVDIGAALRTKRTVLRHCRLAAGRAAADGLLITHALNPLELCPSGSVGIPSIPVRLRRADPVEMDGEAFRNKHRHDFRQRQPNDVRVRTLDLLHERPC